jgi:hypothetical protein
MIGRWWAEAGKYNVLPIDGDVRSRLAVERPTIAKPRDKIILYPGGSSIPFAATPKLYNRPWSITADVVIPRAAPRGCCWPRAGAPAGTSSLSKTSDSTSSTTSSVATSSGCIPTRQSRRVKSNCATSSSRPASPIPAEGYGVPARGQLYINRKLVGSIDMPYSILFMFGTQGLSCGYDAGDPAAPEEYSGEFRFTGTIKRVTIDLSGELIPDSEADMRVAMARQ